MICYLKLRQISGNLGVQQHEPAQEIQFQNTKNKKHAHKHIQSCCCCCFCCCLLITWHVKTTRNLSTHNQETAMATLPDLSLRMWIIAEVFYFLHLRLLLFFFCTLICFCGETPGALCNQHEDVPRPAVLATKPFDAVGGNLGNSIAGNESVDNAAYVQRVATVAIAAATATPNQDKWTAI